jgi:hypothetical protein
LVGVVAVKVKVGGVLMVVRKGKIGGGGGSGGGSGGGCDENG